MLRSSKYLSFISGLKYTIFNLQILKYLNVIIIFIYIVRMKSLTIYLRRHPSMYHLGKICSLIFKVSYSPIFWNFGVGEAPSIIIFVNTLWLLTSIWDFTLEKNLYNDRKKWFFKKNLEKFSMYHCPESNQIFNHKHKLEWI